MGRSDAKAKAKQQAKALEAANQIDAAVRVYLDAGDPMDAAAVLTRHARFGEAGKVLLAAVGVTPAQMRGLSGPARKMAQMAASYLARSEDTALAVELFVALDEPVRAAELLERRGDMLAAQRLRERSGRRGPAPDASIEALGAAARQRAADLEREGKLEVAAQVYLELKQHGDAGRLLYQLGRFESAAQMFAAGGMPYEAASCWLRVTDYARALDQLFRVDRNDQRYRGAAIAAVQVAVKLKQVSFQLEHFLTQLLRTGPRDDRERQAFVALSDLYVQQDAPSNAREVLGKVIEAFPADLQARERLAALPQSSTGRPSSVFQRIGAEDAPFLGEQGRAVANEYLPGLPDLPPAPVLATSDPSSAPVAPLGGTRMGLGPNAPAAAPAGVPAATPYEATVVPPSPEAATRPVGGSQGAAAANGDDIVNRAEAFAIGAVLGGRYRLDAKIGQGGMATVFSAFDVDLEEQVALKVFFGEIQDPALQAQSLARFKQELKLNRQLAHENILRLYDTGVWAGCRYISMELLVGRPLDALMNGPMHVGLALAYLVQACHGLDAAHARGVVHRDIKPQNLFITDEDVLKIMDFGIAKMSAAGNLTRTGMIAGTPRYMSPEQFTGFGTVTGAADLYSLGAVAYEMLCGVPPFQHDELMPLIMMKINDTPVPMRSHREDLPQELDEMVMRLLSKDPADRPASCQEVALALQRTRSRYRLDQPG